DTWLRLRPAGAPETDTWPGGTAYRRHTLAPGFSNARTWGAERDRAPITYLSPPAGGGTDQRLGTRRFRAPSGGWGQESLLPIRVAPRPDVSSAEMTAFRRELSSAIDAFVNEQDPGPASGDQLHLTVTLLPAPAADPARSGAVVLARRPSE